jgi:hypothetical protein
VLFASAISIGNDEDLNPLFFSFFSFSFLPTSKQQQARLPRLLDMLDSPGKPDKLDKPDKPDKIDQPDNPDKLYKPDKLGKVD